MTIASTRFVFLPKPKRRWFQFRLRTLFVLVVVAAAPCVWLKAKLDRKQKERVAIAEIESLGGFVLYDWENADQEGPPGPAWLRRLFGDDFFARMIWSDICGQEVTDGSLVYLDPLADLEFVDLSGAEKITDNGLCHLKALSHLRALVLGAGVTDQAVGHLKELTQLRELIVEDSSVTDAGVAELQKALPNCKILR